MVFKKLILNKLETNDDIKVFRNNYKLINKVKLLINEALGLLPFLTIGNLFIFMSTRITAFIIRKATMNISIFLDYWFETVIYIIIHLILIIIVNQIKVKENKMHESILNKICDKIFDGKIESDFQIKLHLILEEIKSFQHKPGFDAWNVFNIDKKLVLTFISCLLTFTVVLFQFT